MLHRAWSGLSILSGRRIGAPRISAENGAWEIMPKNRSSALPGLKQQLQLLSSAYRKAESGRADGLKISWSGSIMNPARGGGLWL